jgi:hypothetical protein
MKPAAGSCSPSNDFLLQASADSTHAGSSQFSKIAHANEFN